MLNIIVFLKLMKNSQLSTLNSQLAFIFTLILISLSAAQVLPGVNSLPGFYKAGIRYGEAKGDSLHIRWARAADADTFWVYKGGSSVEFIITSENIRTVWYNQPMRYERRMATHHLREFILDSPLKFENLENLAKDRSPYFFGKSLREYFAK